MNISRKHIMLLAISGLVSSVLFGQKEDPPKGWHMMDKATTGYYGLSVDKAYAFVKAKKLKSKTIIVAVIDSGIDTTHEDLKKILWKNPKEIPGNGIDDDKNGYVDDIYGWNFLGGRDGNNVEQDSYEAARVYHNQKAKWGDKEIDESKLSVEELFDYQAWKRAKNEVVGEVDPAELAAIKNMFGTLSKGDATIRKDLSKEKYDCNDLKDYKTTTGTAADSTKRILVSICRNNDNNNEISNQDILDQLEGEINKMMAAEEAPKNYRNDVVKDNYNDFNDKFYGNPNVMVSNKSALHGTHVSGIIAASRGNGVGMDGVADNVRIMSLRAVPDGDEHDKDIALAIRYAADNGAQVINMSFGKSYSPEKKWVDEAVKYAESKGVLLVHAAGNDAKNIDTTFNYPCPLTIDNKRPGNWITVGASGDPKAGGVTASFSNYGKKEVDVFAPGVRIYSTVPGGNTYQNLQGTSMASPVVAGLAAFILEYYPNLSAAQVKMVIEKSSSKLAEKVKNPETGEMVALTDISKAGGVVNAFEAIKLASTLKGERKAAPAKPVKSSVKPKVNG